MDKRLRRVFPTQAFSICALVACGFNDDLRPVDFSFTQLKCCCSKLHALFILVREFMPPPYRNFAQGKQHLPSSYLVHYIYTYYFRNNLLNNAANFGVFV